MEDADNKDRNYEPMETGEDCSPDILEEIEIEDLAVDGICGVY